MLTSFDEWDIDFEIHIPIDFFSFQTDTDEIVRPPRQS